MDTSRVVLRLNEGVPVEPLRFLTPAEARDEMRAKFPTGPQLADEIDAFLKTRPDVSRQRFGVAFSGSPDAVRTIRRRAYPRPQTVAKARALMADVPDECLKRETPRISAARERGYTLRPRRGEQTLEDYQRKCHIRAQKLAKNNRRKAEARIAAGLSSMSCSSVSIKITQRILEDTNAQLARYSDPVEQALTKLRRDRQIIFRASVIDGPHNQFVLRRRSGDEIISEDQLLQMAQRAA